MTYEYTAQEDDLTHYFLQAMAKRKNKKGGKKGDRGKATSSPHPNGKLFIMIQDVQKVYNLAPPLPLSAFIKAGLPETTSEKSLVTAQHVRAALLTDLLTGGMAEHNNQGGSSSIGGSSSPSMADQRWQIPLWGGEGGHEPQYWDGPDLDERRAAAEGEDRWGDKADSGGIGFRSSW